MFAIKINFSSADWLIVKKVCHPATHFTVPPSFTCKAFLPHTKGISTVY